jgi:ribonuclease VapC
MVVDTSALLAILLGEPDAAKYAQTIEAEALPRIGSPTLVEASAVALGRGGSPLLHQLRSIFREAGFDIVPFSAEHAEIAAEAYQRYGRGVGDPACLNMGDCFSYALARALDEPLLYKGGDFARTDIRSAL